MLFAVYTSLKAQWEKAFDEFKFIQIPEIYSLQDIARIEDVKENLKSIPVGLFVFDESHNLRSSGGQRFDVFIKWRQANENANTLLVTATPINNQLSDLTNQIMLGSGGAIHKLGRFYDRARQKFYTIQERLQSLQDDIKRQLRENRMVNYQQIREQLTPLLNRFIVRRSRQGIENEYPDGIEINGELQKFPQSFPDNLEYELPNQFKTQLLTFASKFNLLFQAYNYTDESLSDLEYLAHPLDLFEFFKLREKPIQTSLEVLYTGLLTLGFPCYRYNMYRWAYYKKKRGDLHLNVDENRELSRQIGIYGIFRTIFLKRLESSIYSIQVSILNYKRKLTEFKDKLEKYNKIISVKNLEKLNKAVDAYNEQRAEDDELDFDISSFEEEDGEPLSIDADEGKFNIKQLKSDIEKDLMIISVLKEQLALLVKKDNKIKVLADKLDENEESKVLVFTYFSDTLKYLQMNLPRLLRNKKNIEFALGTKGDIENFARRFAPVSKKYQIKENEQEINFLVATDKLSEGQNLQDCGIIINYDLHWNPVRMIQRNGRINRIGSLFNEIFIYNFRPTDQLENYLKLVRKLEDKINLIRYTIGSDQSILDEEPIPQDFTEDLYSRDEKKRLEAFRKIFDSSEFLAADDLFMDDLREFDRSEKYNDVYKNIVKTLPKGKWGNVQMRADDDDFVHLAHMVDEKNEAGYFVTFDKSQTGELITPTEGLLHIKATSDQNQRFKDNFNKKPQTESYITNFIKTYQFTEDEHKNRFNKSQEEAIIYIRNKMIEYGYPVETIEKVYNCIMYSQNAYSNKQNMKLVRLVARLARNNKHIGDEVIQEFLDIAIQYKPEEKTEKAPLSEIIQIFT